MTESNYCGVHTDYAIQHRTSGIVMLYKIERKYHPTDNAVPGIKRVKVENYSHLKHKVKKIWNLSQVLPAAVVIGTLGMTLKRFKEWLKKLDIKKVI